MSQLLMERPSAPIVEQAWPRTPDLPRLVQRLESWLPAEEERLMIARRQGRPVYSEEAEWRAMLGLYERLCVGVGVAA